MHRGHTLIEVSLSVVLLGLLAMVASLAIGPLRDRLATDLAARTVVAAHSRARLVALAERHPAILLLTPDSLVLRSVEAPGDTTLRWRDAGPVAQGVTVTGMPRRVTFAPSGVTLGVANTTYQFTRGAVRRLVIVSRYGRVRVQ